MESANMTFFKPRAIPCLPATRSAAARLLPLAFLFVGAYCSGCVKPAATESVAPAATDEQPPPPEVSSTSDSATEEMPAEPEVAATPASVEDASAVETEAEAAALQEWRPDEELARQLAAEPVELGGYSIRLPKGFVEVGRSTDSPDSKQPYLFAFRSPVEEGATPAVMSVTVHPPGEEFPDRDTMLAAFFANVATQWPDSQRKESEQGAVSGFPATRAFYEASLPSDLTLKGVVYLIDHGTQRIVLQGAANSSTPDYPIEVIDAAMQTFGRRQE